ncbi:MAG: ABC transporter ATP-binding protein [Limnobacter sp.]|nr:ABC transporter ATP-binding protein [Limnobacter sp.]
MTNSVLLKVERLNHHVQDGHTTLTILQDISFHVGRGEAVAIVGASGSGKSTLLAMLAGLDVPSQGNIVFDGENLTRLNEDQRAGLRAKQVGFVFQSFQLLEHLTALENVVLATELTTMPNRRARCVEMLDRVGLGRRLNHTPKTLSGGEQQRVALARAFVRSPSVVFADEPTGSLDSQTGEMVIELMFDLQREHGTTLVLVTHDEKLAQRCARQLVLNSGVLLPEVCANAG